MVGDEDIITLVAFLLVCTFIIVLLSAIVKIRNIRKNLRMHNYLLNKSLTLDIQVKTYKEIIDLFEKKVYINIKREFFIDPIYDYIIKKVSIDSSTFNIESFLHLYLKEYEVTALDEVFLKTGFCKSEYFLTFNLLSNYLIHSRKIKDIVRFDSNNILKSKYPKILGINLVLVDRDGNIYLKKKKFEDLIYPNSFDISTFYPLNEKIIEEVGEFEIEKIVYKILEKEFLISRNKIIEIIPINLCLDLINFGITYCNVFVLVNENLSKYFDICEKNLGKIIYKIIKKDTLKEDIKEEILKNIKSLKSKYRLSTYALSFLDWVSKKVEKG